MSITTEAVKTALSQVLDPNTGKDLVSGKSVKNIQINNADISIDIELGYPAKSQIDGIRKAAIAALRSVPGVGNVSVNAYFKIVAHTAQRGVKLLANVMFFFVVAFGLGGVGFSSSVVFLALVL